LQALRSLDDQAVGGVAAFGVGGAGAEVERLHGRGAGGAKYTQIA